MVKSFFDRRVGWGIAGWRYLSRMGLDRRIGHMVRAVHPKLGSACLVLGRNADLAREIASALTPPEVIFHSGPFQLGPAI